MTSGKPLVVLAAGGTGGHVFPAEALAAELSGRGCRLAVVTDRRGGVWQNRSGDIDVHHICASGVAGKNFAARLQSGPQLAIGTWQARGLLKRLQPKAVIGFGGYASVPTMLAASFGGYHTAIHEQNAILGRANRLLASRAEKIATSFDQTEGLTDANAAKVTRTGTPVRAGVTAISDELYPALGDKGPLSLLVMGGSQGAHVFSQIVPAAMGLLDESLRSRMSVTQQCRPEDLDFVHGHYMGLGIKAELKTFFDDIPQRLKNAHLLISRAGASTVAEALVAGRPSILVPYPHAIDDHQTGNAHAVDEASGGWMIPQAAFTSTNLAMRLDSLFGLPAILEKAALSAKAAGAPDAAQRLADMVLTLLPSNGEGSDTQVRAA